MWLLWGAAMMAMLLTRSCAVPVLGDTDKTGMYPSQYDYLNATVLDPSTNRINEILRSDATSEVQSLDGLDESNVLDEGTDNFMRKPVNDSFIFEMEDYTLFEPRIKWGIKNVTYSITKYSTKLSQEEVDREIARAFSLWSTYIDLTFTQKTSGPVHIDIRFEKGNHGDKQAFDGPGNILGHGNPSLLLRNSSGFEYTKHVIEAGIAHFDDSETWTIDSVEGINLFQVATHEFGHILGLHHSKYDFAVMGPDYHGYDPNFSLTQDDILGIQALYGPKTNSATLSTPLVTISPAEEPALLLGILSDPDRYHP